jgi:hypothetical protein
VRRVHERAHASCAPRRQQACDGADRTEGYADRRQSRGIVRADPKQEAPQHRHVLSIVTDNDLFQGLPEYNLLWFFSDLIEIVLKNPTFNTA